MELLSLYSGMILSIAVALTVRILLYTCTMYSILLYSIGTITIATIYHYSRYSDDGICACAHVLACLQMHVLSIRTV